ncbi:MAG: hypothetical protein M1510_09635 [Nitrospirae bacterium]|nr:hypothetical protein [Nitrospirota bacterium]MCL5238369.1 hypothetical protein [Nitrospirota bacterium]
MRALGQCFLVFAVITISCFGTRASEIRQMDYQYLYEFAKDFNKEYVFVICDICPTMERLALKPREIPLAIMVTVPQPEMSAPAIER